MAAPLLPAVKSSPDPYTDHLAELLPDSIMKIESLNTEHKPWEKIHLLPDSGSQKLITCPTDPFPIYLHLTLLGPPGPSFHPLWSLTSCVLPDRIFPEHMAHYYVNLVVSGHSPYHASCKQSKP